MAIQNNVLQQVKTYNEANMALLLNMNVWLNLANMKFRHFNDQIPTNLGSSVSFDIPTRFITSNTLTPAFQAAVQRIQNLTVDQKRSISYAFDSQQYIFNVRDYMDQFGRSAMAEMSAAIEIDLGTVASYNTYRYFGDGLTNISTSLQLDKLIEQFRVFGAAKNDTKCVLNNLSYPNIVNSNLSQFAQMRNDREALSWEVGSFNGCDFYRSNLLHRHVAGNVGNDGVTLTVVSVVTNADGGVIQITFSGASASDADAIKHYDKATFNDGVAGRNNLRFLTYYGHFPSEAPVQFRVEADAASDVTGEVTVDIFPPLQAASGAFQNINTEIVAGMQVTFLPTHRCGLIMAGRPFYVAMPTLPSTNPFPSHTAVDSDTGASIRMYSGWLIDQAAMGTFHDSIWGKTGVDDYMMMVAIPDS